MWCSDTEFKRSRRPRSAALLLLIPLLLLCGSSRALAQAATLINFSKSTNAPNPVEAGVEFLYTIGVSWTGGVPLDGTIQLSDVIPTGLQFVSSLPTATVTGSGTSPYIYKATGITSTAGSVTWQIKVQFAPGATCPGARACNEARAGQGNAPTSWITSNRVCATAKATNFWTIQKSPYTPCSIVDDGFSSREFVYRLRFINPQAPYGMTMKIVDFIETLPDYATVQDVWMANGTHLTPPTQISMSPNKWHINFAVGFPELNAGNYWYVLYVKVRYPGAGIFVPNQAVYSTTELITVEKCDTTQEYTTLTATANETICDIVPGGGGSKKFLIPQFYPNNPFYQASLISPNCCGRYRVDYVNNGTIQQTNIVMTDDVPHTVDVSNISVDLPAGLTSAVVKVYTWNGTSCQLYSTSPTFTATQANYFPSGATNICKIVWSYTGTLAPNTRITNDLSACIRSASYSSPFATVLAGDQISNRATVTGTGVSPTPYPLPHDMDVDVTTPYVIAHKSYIGTCDQGVANPGPIRLPGDIVRFRMAVTNLGNANATSCTITDVLEPGFSYVGNETYYYGPILPAGMVVGPYLPSCGDLALTPNVSGISQIGGTISHASTGNPATGETNEWTFPKLEKDCDGTPSYFIIEFDVKISSAPPKPPGTYPNRFSFDAAELSSVVNSNNAYVTVGTTGILYAVKEVRALPDGEFSQSATIPPGGSGEYRITILNTIGMHLQNLCVMDIMPHVGDMKVLPPYTPGRGSQFDIISNGGVSVLSPVVTAPLPVPGFTIDYNSGGTTKNPTRNVCGGFCGIANPSGAQTWTPVTTVPVAGTYSFAVSAKPGVNLAPGASFVVLVPFTVPSTAIPGETACNSFAYQTTPLNQTTPCLSAEPTPACVTVGPKTGVDDCTGCDTVKQAPYDFGGNNLSGRTITVYNRKIPASPISKVKIALSPLPFPPGPGGFQWNGGPAQISIDAGTPTAHLTAWGVTNSYESNPALPRYSRITMACAGEPVASQGAAAEESIEFNLGVDRSNNWIGVATITVFHCDGDSCQQTFDWCALENLKLCPGLPTPPVDDVLVRDRFVGAVRAGRLLIAGSRRAKVSYAIIEPDRASGAQIVAMGPRETGMGEKSRSMAAISSTTVFSSDSARRYAARIEFAGGIRPTDTVEIPFVLELPAGSESRMVPVSVRLYDENSNLLMEDTASASIALRIDATTGSAMGIGAELMQPEPTPTDGMVRFRYWLSTSRSVTLELFDGLGALVATLERGQREAGDHSLMYNSRDIASGTYMLRLTTPLGSLVHPVIVQH
jgi:uncharacterized repeat protein (TIGR01451 family)